MWRWIVALAAWSTPAWAQTVLMGDAVDRPITNPQGIVRCAGNLYVADISAGRIRAVMADGSWKPTVVSGLSLPSGLACLDGVLYVTQAAEVSSVVSRIDAYGNVVPVAKLVIGASPRGLARLGTGLVFAAFGTNGANASSVWAWNGAEPIRLAGTGVWDSSGDGGPALQAALRSPYGVGVLDSAVIVSEIGGHRIRRFTAGGTISTLAGDGVAGFSGDGGLSMAARVNGPQYLVVDGSDIYFSDTGNSRVRRIRSARIDTVLNLTGIGAPTGLYVEAGLVYVSLPGRQEVRSYPLPGVTPQPTATATVQPTITRPVATPTIAPVEAPTCQPGCVVRCG